MIGIQLRGIRHLWRISDSSLRKILIKCGDHGFALCEVIKTPKDSMIGERMFVFNPYYNQCNYNLNSLSSTLKELRGQLSNVTNNRTIEITKDNCHNFTAYDHFINDILLLPNTFDKDYAAFLKENTKMIANLQKKYCFSTDDTLIKRIYIYSEGSKNFFQWAVGLYFSYGVTITTIRNILTWNEHYKQLTKNLSKGTITAYTSQDSVYLLMEELSALRNEKRIVDAINSFNTAQKKILKNNDLSPIDKQSLARFSKLSEVKKNNFIRKVSNIDDFQELMRQMRHVTSVHFQWSKESFMDFIENVEGINYKLIYENEAVVLVRVSDYDTIKQLAKTTNWCISKNKSYWNNYIENNRGKSFQYMIFDFSKLEDDKLSIIGFTTTYNKGITSAHNFVNDNLMGNESVSIFIKSYLSQFNNSRNIYKILQNCGIDINLVAHYDKPSYKWDFESLMSYLYECVEKENVDILMHKGNKLVLSVRDENIKYFLGDVYIDNISSEDYDEQHIIFADFSISQYDPNKLLFAIIYRNDEDYCNGIYNETAHSVDVNFDSKLLEFGLPYNAIRRTDDILKRVRDAFMSFNTNILFDCVKIDEKCLNRVMKDMIDEDRIFSVITSSITDYLSFDYLNLIYDNNHFISDYLESDYICEIINTVFNNLKYVARHLYRNNILEMPNDEKIKAFFNEELRNRNEAIYIGSYLILKKIIEKECERNKNHYIMLNRVTHNILSSRLCGGVIKELAYLIFNNLDMSQEKESSVNIVKYFVIYGDDEMQHTIQNLIEKYSWVKSVYDNALKTKQLTEDMNRSRVTINMPHFDIA